MTDMLAHLDGLPALASTPAAEDIAENSRLDRQECKMLTRHAAAVWKSSHTGPERSIRYFRQALKVARSKTERARIQCYLNEYQRREDAFEAQWQDLLNA